MGIINAQLHVTTYKTVLCFPDYKVSIACDDNDHRDHEIEFESEGQKASEKSVILFAAILKKRT